MSDREIVVACPCPGTPHEADTITLYEKLPSRLGLACYAVLKTMPGLSVAGITGAWAEELGRGGIERWTLVTENDKGKTVPLEPSPHAYEALPFAIQAAIGNAAMGRWSEELMSPLPTGTATSSPAGQTGKSTSPNRPSGPTPRAPSKRSSPNGLDGRPSVVQAR